jgi:hypothetical protein
VGREVPSAAMHNIRVAFLCLVGSSLTGSGPPTIFSAFAGGAVEGPIGVSSKLNVNSGQYSSEVSSAAISSYHGRKFATVVASIRAVSNTTGVCMVISFILPINLYP